MAVGKTTLGKIVAKKQKLAFADIDKLIEKKNLMTISEIFKKKGEDLWRSESVNLRRNDLAKAILVLQKAQEELLMEQSMEEHENE